MINQKQILFRVSMTMLLLIGMMGIVQAQSLDEILNNMHSALGTESLKSEKTLQFDLTIASNNGEQKSHVTARGNRNIRVDVEHGKKLISYVRSGDAYWMELGNTVKSLDNKDLKQTLNRQHLVRGLMKTLKMTENLVQDAKVKENNKDLMVIKSIKNNKTYKLFVDPQTWLPVKFKEVRSKNSGDLVIVTKYEQFQAYGNILLPTRQIITTTDADGKTKKEVFTMSNIRIGHDVNDMVFAKRSSNP